MKSRVVFVSSSSFKLFFDQIVEGGGQIFLGRTKSQNQEKTSFLMCLTMMLPSMKMKIVTLKCIIHLRFEEQTRFGDIWHELYMLTIKISRKLYKCLDKNWETYVPIRCCYVKIWLSSKNVHALCFFIKLL